MHSEYSLLDGAIRIPELVERAVALGHKAVALTDHGAMFGAIELYLAAKDKGIKAILGCEIFHSPTPGTESFLRVMSKLYKDFPQNLPPELRVPTDAFHLVLLAKDLLGYKNLVKLVSSGYQKGLNQHPEKVIPIVADQDLEHGQGEGEQSLIALSGCQMGEMGYLVRLLRHYTGARTTLVFDPEKISVPETKAVARALKDYVATMLRRFGKDHFYVELINNQLPEQMVLLPDLVAAADHYGLPLVATADAHYLHKDHGAAHGILLGIKHSLTMSEIRGRRKNTAFHLFDNDEMQQIYGAWPSALENIQKIVDSCNVKFEFNKYYLPKFETGQQETPDEAIKRLSEEMLEERFITLSKVYGPTFDEASRASYRKRLAYELDVICKMGFASYFLIVQDFINWAKKNGIPVGPGRGSGAGSLVAYALRITDLDPIPYNLLFERFLNPDRVSMPDFDVDFCQDRRGEVIQYVTAKYGEASVAQITTFGKMNAKAVIRDVGRVLELGYGRVDRIAKLIPDDLGITLEEALKKEPRINEEAKRDDTIADLLRFAQNLESLVRHVSVHAAGIVISDGPMTDYVPVYTTGVPGETQITQYEMKMAEKVGLVKFDFLGLKTLTVIQKAVHLIHARGHRDFDIDLIPLDDQKVFQDISAGHTVGVFQLESAGMRSLVTKLKPNCFEDVIALVALFRPGPLGSGMVDDFIERKHGRAEIQYLLPQLESILKETYGIILYQEQVMKIAGELASYTLGEADLLRRAMGKKITSEMEKQKQRFANGAATNGHDPTLAGQIFDLMAEFANYGFNKSHSAAYGLVSYQTAYLKTHFPSEYMAAIMTCDLDKTSKVVRYIDECKRLRITVHPPCINTSFLEFTVPDNKQISFGLSAVKGIGPQSVEPLVQEREKNGPFPGLYSLARRVDLHRVGKKTLELLTQVGALDCFGISRLKLMSNLGKIVKFSESFHSAKAVGQQSLFDDALDTVEPETHDGGSSGNQRGESSDASDEKSLLGPLLPQDEKVGAPSPSWLRKEKALLGVYMTGHPMTFHGFDRRVFANISLDQVVKLTERKQVAIVAVLSAVNERLTKNNTRMASIRLEDEKAAIEAVIFQEEIPKEFPPAESVVLALGSAYKVNRGGGAAGKPSGPPPNAAEPVRFRIEKLLPIESVRKERATGLTLRIETSLDQSLKRDWQQETKALKALVKDQQGDTPLTLIIDYDGTEVLMRAHSIEPSDEFLEGVRLIGLPLGEIKLSIRQPIKIDEPMEAPFPDDLMASQEHVI